MKAISRRAWIFLRCMVLRTDDHATSSPSIICRSSGLSTPKCSIGQMVVRADGFDLGSCRLRTWPWRLTNPNAHQRQSTQTLGFVNLGRRLGHIMAQESEEAQECVSSKHDGRLDTPRRDHRPLGSVGICYGYHACLVFDHPGRRLPRASGALDS